MVDVEVVVKAKDAATAKVKAVDKGLGGLVGKATEVSASFLLITNAIGTATQALSDFFAGALDTEKALTRSAILMNDVAVTAGSLSGTIEDLQKSNVGAIFSENELANAFLSVSDEGHGLAGTMTVLDAAMNLAAITGNELTTISKGLEDVLSAFGLQALDAANATDVLLNTQRETGAEITSDLLPSLKTLGALASSLGIEFEEMAAILGVLKDAGVGSVQGLFMGFQQMASGVGEAAKMVDHFGVSVTDSEGRLKPLLTVMGELVKAGAKAEDMFLAFGQRSASAMTVVIDRLEEMRTTAESNFDATGDAAAAAGEFMDSTAGQTEVTQKAFEDLKDELAEGLLPALSDLLSILTPIFNFLGDYPEVIYAAATAYGVWTIATWDLFAAQTALNAALVANPVGAAIAGMVLLVGWTIWVWKNYEKWKEKIWAVGAAMVFLTGGLLLIPGLIVGIITVIKNWGDITDWIVEKTNAFVDFFMGMPGRVKGWGADFINNIIDDMVSAFNKRWGEVKGIWDKIEGVFSHDIEANDATARRWGRDFSINWIQGAGQGMGESSGAIQAVHRSMTNTSSTTNNNFLPGLRNANRWDMSGVVEGLAAQGNSFAKSRGMAGGFT